MNVCEFLRLYLPTDCHFYVCLMNIFSRIVGNKCLFLSQSADDLKNMEIRCYRQLTIIWKTTEMFRIFSAV